MREIKFRAWCKLDKILYDWEQVKKEFTLEYFDDKGLIFQQYTGLKDKNGVEIYEGDVVEYIYGWRFEVVFKEFSFGWTEDGFVPFVNMAKSEFLKFEVIGNIHDNPELLKTKKSS